MRAPHVSLCVMVPAHDSVCFLMIILTAKPLDDSVCFTVTILLSLLWQSTAVSCANLPIPNSSVDIVLVRASTLNDAFACVNGYELAPCNTRTDTHKSYSAACAQAAANLTP